MISACAIAVSGDNVRIRRVRIINFGSQNPVNYNGTENKYPWPNGPAIRTFEGFPIRIGGRRIRRFGPPVEGNQTPNSQDMVSFHDVFEDCILEQPYPSNAREVTNVMVGGLLNGVSPDQNPPEALHRQPAASLMRGNYLNYDFINERSGNQIRVKQVEVLGSLAPVTVRITCQFPHLVTAGDFVELSGSDVAALNGRFQVTAIVGSAITSVALDLTFSPVPAKPTAAMLLRKSPRQTMRAGEAALNRWRCGRRPRRESSFQLVGGRESEAMLQGRGSCAAPLGLRVGGVWGAISMSRRWRWERRRREGDGIGDP